MSLKFSSTRPRQLQYSGKGLRTDLRLLEVDDALLSEITANGVVIKGDDAEDAVLCTDDKTFALKYVETTNTLLLLPPDEGGDAAFGGVSSLTPPDASHLRDVGLQTQLQKAARAEDNPPLVATATAVAHIEVVRILPRLSQLRELLGSCRPYGVDDEASPGDGMEVDGEEGAPKWRRMMAAAAGSGGGGGGEALGFTTEQLLERVQCSRAELLAELNALNALCIEGRWRLVDEEYLGGLLEVILLSATEAGWPLHAVPLAEAAAALAGDGYRPPLVRHCLRVHGSSGGGGGSGSGGAASGGGAAAAEGEDEVYALDRSKVCLHFLRKLLRQRRMGGGGGGGGGAAGGWRRSELMAAWAAAVPEEWGPPEAALMAGEALEELPEGSLPGDEPLVVPFAARDLPLDPARRFAALFKQRPRWERSALEPYLAALVSGASGHTVESLLLRNARASQATPDSPVLFSAR